MSTNLQIQSFVSSTQSDGGVWYQLHSEREEICDALVREPWPSNQCRALLGNAINVAELQKRLRLIDNALDRLTAGSYGDCIVCRSRINDAELQADPALPYCHDCEREYANTINVPPSLLDRCAEDEH